MTSQRLCWLVQLCSGIGLCIQSLEDGGRAHQDGRLRVRDRIKEVNGSSIADVDFNRSVVCWYLTAAVQLLASVIWIATTGTILQLLYRTTCVSRHPYLRTGGFCWSTVLLPACSCWQQVVHSDEGEDARVLSGVICTISVPSHHLCALEFLWWVSWWWGQRMNYQLEVSALSSLQCFDTVALTTVKASDSDP